MSFISIPFKTESGMSQIEGIGKFSAAGIVLEFESKLFGIISDGVKENRIALDDILDVNFRKGVFKRGAKIVVRLKSYAKLSEMPNRDGKITLKIPRADYARAAQAVEILNKNLTARQQSLPETQTPVSRLFDESEDETQKLDGK